MKIKPEMSNLQKKLVEQINRYRTLNGAVVCLHKSLSFQSVSETTLLRWTKLKIKNGSKVESRIKESIAFLEKNEDLSSSEKQLYSLIVELDRNLAVLSGGIPRDITATIKALSEYGDTVTLLDVVFLLKAEEALGIKMTAALAKEVLSARNQDRKA